MIAALVVLASLASVARPAQQPACYFPNGDAAPGQLPCHLGGHATCCEEGYACLSNRICKASSAAAVDKGPLYARGACTDRFWESQSCPPFCRTQGYDVMDGQQLMHKCANNDTLFYCESSVKPDCENSKRVIINPCACRGPALAAIRLLTGSPTDSPARAPDDACAAARVIGDGGDDDDE